LPVCVLALNLERAFETPEVQRLQDRSTALLMLAWLAAAALACVLLDRPPAPAPASAPADVFSAARAFVYLNEFAQKPHPVGTAEHDRVRDYLSAQITNLGLTPEIQRTTGVTPIYQAAGKVENIVARLGGTSGRTDALLLAAHYDSVPAGPGAGDDGAGVAALLETTRALRAGPALQNDVILLFTDGEEEGMLGASAFADQHLWAKDVRVAANFEGRGNAGNSQLFETSVGNGRLVQVLAKAARHPSGSSFTYEVYKHMPNDTDMTVFKKSGIAGLNFAFIGHWEAYHTPLDNPQALDLASLQQHGEYALGLARTLGNADLAQLSAPDAVYFSIPGGLFLHYPSGSAWRMVLLALVAFLASWFYASGAYQTGVVPLLVGLALSLGLLLLLMLTAFVFVKGVAQVHRAWLPDGDVAKSALYTLSLIALLIAVATTAYKSLLRKTTWSALFLGGAAILLSLSAVAARWFPGGSYLFAWPLLAALLAAVFAAFNREQISPRANLALCVLVLPPLVLLVPNVRGTFDALGLTTLGAPSLALVLGLLLLSLLPLLETLLKMSGWLVPVLAFLAAVLLFALGTRVTRYSSAHPKPGTITYALDTDTAKALWASTADRPDGWTAQYVGSSPARAKLSGFYPDWLPFAFLQHDAPALPLQPTQVAIVENSAAAETRTLRLRITSPRHARVVSAEVPDNEVVDGWVNDRRLGQPAESRWNKHGKWAFDYANLPPEGIELRLQTRGTGPVKLIVVDRSIGLPDVPGVTFSPRPADAMQIHSGDETMVRHTFVF
jgi:hypothetical protein